MDREMYPAALRKYTWDVTPCNVAPAVMITFGLIPGSEEGMEVEHKASHARLDLQDPIQDEIATAAAFAARALAAYALRLDHNQYPIELISAVTTQFAESIHIGTTSIIANLLSDGYLQLGPMAGKGVVPVA